MMRIRLLGLLVVLFALTAGATTARASTTLDGQWHLDEGSGTTTADSSGNGNNGTLTASATWVGGLFGRALSFNGTPGYVTVPGARSLQTPQVSVSAWVNHSGTPGAYRYIVAKGATDVAASYALYTGSDGGLAFYVSKDAGKTFQLSPREGPGIWDGNWHLVVGTFDGSTVRLYVDGNQVGSGMAYSGTIQYPNPTNNDLYIGDYPLCQNGMFTGTIDEVSVWNHALSQSEVQQLLGGPSQTPFTHNPGGGSGGSGGGSAPGVPLISLLRMSPASFATRAKGSRHKGRRRTSSQISYFDTQRARSTLTVFRQRPGIRKHRKCVAAARHARVRRSARCTRSTAVGSFTRTDRVGRNTFTFSGVLHGHHLPAGTYRLSVTPVAFGKTGRTRSIGFKIMS